MTGAWTSVLPSALCTRYRHVASCLVGSRGIGMVVGVALQAEQARVAEQPVGVPGVRCVLAHVPAGPALDPGGHGHTSGKGRPLEPYFLQTRALQERRPRSRRVFTGETPSHADLVRPFSARTLATVDRCADVLDGAFARVSPNLAYTLHPRNIHARLRDEVAQRRLRANVTSVPTPRSPTRHENLPCTWCQQQPIACMGAPQRS